LTKRYLCVMNYLNRVFVSTFFLTIWFVAGLTLYTSDNRNESISNPVETTQIHDSATSFANTAGHVLPTERSNYSIQNSVPTVAKKTSDHLSAYIRCNEKLIVSFLFQYLNYSECLLVHFRKTDIIFPFHYFW